MKNDFLNGKISLTSISTPTEDEMKLIGKLTDKEKSILLDQILKKAQNSPLSNKSIDDIWQTALTKAELRSDKQSKHAI